MAEYTIVLTRTAQKQLDKLPDQVTDLLLETIEKLVYEPRPDGYKKLKGRSGYRIRKEDYRDNSHRASTKHLRIKSKTVLKWMTPNPKLAE